MGYPTVILPTPTVLQRITTEYENRINAIQDEDNSRLWNKVIRGQLVGNNPLMFPICAIHQGPEQTVLEMWPHIEKVVTFYVEFRFSRIENIDSLDTFQYYLGKLQQRLFGTKDNLTLGGLTTNALETNNNPEIESDVDPSPGGLLIYQTYYRHWNGDPYHLPSETPNYAYGSI